MARLESMTKKALISELESLRKKVNKFEAALCLFDESIADIVKEVPRVGIDHLVEGLWIIDKAGFTVFVNPSLAEMLEYTSKEMLGRHLFEFMTEKEKAYCEECLAKRENGVREVHDFVFQTKTGKNVYTRLGASPIKDEKGEYAGAIASVIDMSDVHRLQEQLQSNFDNAPIGMAHMDLNGKFILVNKVLSELLGYSPEELLTMSVLSVTHPDDKESCFAYKNSVLAGETQGKLEKRHINKDGGVSWGLFSLSLVTDRNGKPEYFIAAIEDIASAKRAERLFEVRLHLMEFAVNHSLNELMVETLDVVEELTNSQIGYFHFLEPDQKTLSLQAWSTHTTQKMCKAEARGMHYAVDEAGVWVDCVHKRETVIHNDYAVLKHKKGLPPGHAPIIREMGVPVFRDEAIVAILGVGNKPSPYTQIDVDIIMTLADVTWDIVERKQISSEIENLARFPNQNPNPILRVDKNGVVLYANDAARTLLDDIGVEQGAKLSGEISELFLSTSTLADGGLSDFECVGRFFHLSIVEIADSGYVNIYGMDITQRREIEQNLKESEEQFRMHYESGLVGMVLVNLDMTATLYNEKFCKIVGHSREELENIKWPDITHPDDVEENLRLLDLVMAGESDSYSMDKRYIRKNGEIVYTTIFSKCIRKEDGTPKHLITHVMDITERVKAEMEAKWNLQVNMALARLYPPLIAPNVTIKKSSDLILEEAMLLTGSEYGYSSMIGVEGNVIQSFSDMMGNCSVLGDHGDVVFSKGPDGKYSSLWGHSLNTLQSFFTNTPMEHPASLGLPEGHIMLDCFLSVPVMLGNKLVGQLAIANKPGGYDAHDLEAIMRMAAYYGLAIQRVQSQQELSASKELQESILDGIQVGVVIIDPKSKVIESINGVALEMLRATEEDLVGKTCDIICWQKIDGSEVKGCPARSEDVRDWELRMRRLDGTILPVSKTVLEYVVDGENKYLEILFDITDRKELERRLNLAQKLESIGQLSAGIAHEINTPTQYLGDNLKFFSGAFYEVLNLLQKLHTQCVPEEGQEERRLCKEANELWLQSDMDYLIGEIPVALSQSQDGIRRISSIVKAMKQFSHPGVESKQFADINKNLESTVTVCRNEWKYHSDIIFELSSDLPEVSCYINDLNQAFLNIIVNAAHSITSKAKSENKIGSIIIRTWFDKYWVVIEFEDSGEGIPDSALPRIFDPFFTTKEVGLGTGQGLALCYSIIVDKHDGTIDFTSELGVGTTCTIKLPVDSSRGENGT